VSQRNRHQRWLKAKAREAQASLEGRVVLPPSPELQRHLIEDSRRANDAALPWWQSLFYTYRNTEEDDCDL